jgi:hypothetical protein
MLALLLREISASKFGQETEYTKLAVSVAFHNSARYVLVKYFNGQQRFHPFHFKFVTHHHSAAEN